MNEGREGETGVMVQESSLTGSRGGRERCSICLEPISGEGFLDQCFHKFCYHCILQWSEMVISRPSSTSNRVQYLECPLCKTQYTSIIHDVSGAKFQRHYILTSRTPGLLKSEAHIRRQAVYSAHSGSAALQTPRLTDVVPKPNRWISCWVQRELQALMQEEDVETVMHHVVGIVESFCKRARGKVGSSGRQGAKVETFDWYSAIAAAVRPFIFECAETFAVELESFLVSGLDIAAHDEKNKLATCVPGRVTHSDEEITIPSQKKEFCSTYDLYDEDVDEDFTHVRLRQRSSEVEIFTSEESAEIMKQRTREDAGIQERKSSQKDLAVSGKTREEITKKPVKDSRSKLDRGRSKHRSESRRKRRRDRSSSSRSSSPPRHKRRKRDKSVRNHGLKERKHTTRRDKKAVREHKRKSHKSCSRRHQYASTDSSSDSESPRSSRSRSPDERGARRKGRKKDQTFAEEPVSDKADHGKVRLPEREKRTLDRRTRERRKSRHFRSSSSESRETSQTNQSNELLPDNFRKHRQRGERGREGARELERKATSAVDADERSLTRSPEARFRSGRLSSSTSPGARAGRRSWDAHESLHARSPKAMNDEQTITAQRLYVVEEDANELELKLREQALANLMRHLSQKEKATESTSVGNSEEKSAVVTQDLDVPSAVEKIMPQALSQREVLDEGGEKDAKVDKVEHLEISSRNLSENVNHVEEGAEGAHSKTEFTRLTEADKLETIYSADWSSSTQVVEEVMLEGGQSIGIPYDKATALEGRDIVVELVVDTEPFDFDIPYRGTTPSVVIDHHRGNRKDKAKRELAGQLTEGNSNEKADGNMFVEQQDDAQQGGPVKKTPLAPREESVLGEEFSGVDARDCRNREDLALVNPHDASITGELTRDVENVECTDVARFPQQSAKAESTSEKPPSCLNDVSEPEASPKVGKDGDVGGDSAKFQQKSMSVTRGGESIQVSYKVYIPQRAAGARRRLQR